MSVVSVRALANSAKTKDLGDKAKDVTLSNGVVYGVLEGHNVPPVGVFGRWRVAAVIRT